MPINSLQTQATSFLARLAPRERRLLTGAAVLVSVAAVWWIAVSPALATLRRANVLHPQLDAQLQQMQGLKAQALALQTQPKLAGDEAQRALTAVLKQTLGAAAQLAVVGDRATVTLKGAGADALAQCLVQARINARAVPTEVRLVRGIAPNTAPGAAASTTWDGTLVLTLPPRS